MVIEPVTVYCYLHVSLMTGRPNVPAEDLGACR